jgi:hypothetical protein
MFIDHLKTQWVPLMELQDQPLAYLVGELSRDRQNDLFSGDIFSRIVSNVLIQHHLRLKRISLSLEASA